MLSSALRPGIGVTVFVSVFMCLHRGDSALVHYWYLPDSYDEYIPREVAPSRLELDKQVTGPWKVSVSGMRDIERGNVQ